MADTKITALTAITTVDPASDVLPIVDVSDTSMAASGTTKKITSNQILGAGGTATLASATITGDLTVDTSTLKVDSANNRVGVGTASPNNTLTVRGSQDAGIEVNSADSNSSRLITAYDPANTRWYINSTLSGSGTTLPLAFLIQNSEVARFNTTGNLAFANGKGIDFSAVTGGTGTATGNVLNDYEEGTWTPVIADASTGGNTGTCTINSAKYVKIGRQVSVQCDISGITTTGMTAGNVFFIRGLPFTSVQGGDGNFYTYRVGRDAATASSSVHVSDASSVMIFSLYTTNSATADKTLIVSNIVSTTSQIILSVTYFV